MNKPISQAYYLKEQLREIWMQSNKQAAEKVMLDWVKQAQESKVPQLMKMAVTIMAYRTGILAWYDCSISTGEVEGIDNKIKVMKRVSYGFRDERCFQLRLYALHDCRIIPNVGCHFPSILPSRVRARVRRFSFLSFTSSPVCRKRLWHSA